MLVPRGPLCRSLSQEHWVPSGGVFQGHIVLSSVVFVEAKCQESPGANTAQFSTHYSTAWTPLPSGGPLFRNSAHHLQEGTCHTDGRPLASFLEGCIIAHIWNQHRGCTDIKVSTTSTMHNYRAMLNPGFPPRPQLSV